MRISKGFHQRVGLHDGILHAKGGQGDVIDAGSAVTTNRGKVLPSATYVLRMEIRKAFRLGKGEF